MQRLQQPPAALVPQPGERRMQRQQRHAPTTAGSPPGTAAGTPRPRPTGTAARGAAATGVAAPRGPPCRTAVPSRRGSRPRADPRRRRAGRDDHAGRCGQLHKQGEPSPPEEKRDRHQVEERRRRPLRHRPAGHAQQRRLQPQPFRPPICPSRATPRPARSTAPPPPPRPVAACRSRPTAPRSSHIIDAGSSAAAIRPPDRPKCRRKQPYTRKTTSVAADGRRQPRRPFRDAAEGPAREGDGGVSHRRLRQQRLAVQTRARSSRRSAGTPRPRWRGGFPSCTVRRRPGRKRIERRTGHASNNTGGQRRGVSR